MATVSLLVVPDAGATSAAPPDVPPVEESPTGRYLVTFASGPSMRAAMIGASPLLRGDQVVDTLTHATNAVIMEIPHEAALALQRNPRVESVAADAIVELDDTQASPPSWGLDRIDQQNLPLSSSYSYPSTGAGVTVYVLDSGVANHPDFGGRVTQGFTTFNDGMSGRFDCAGHGTHVAGTIGSNTFGVAKAVTIVPIRVMNCQGKGFILSILAGIDWAVGQHGSGPAVLNASIGSDGLDPLWNDGVDWLIDDGITFVTSAGNDAANACSFNPGANPDAITVGSTDIDDELSSYSNTGSCVDVFAPGRQIRSTDFASSGSVTMSGTSMASPHVAGVAAIILGQHPTWTPADVGDVIVMTATPGVVDPPDDHPLNGAPNLLLRLHQDIGAPPNDTFVAASPFDIWGAPAEASTVWASKDAGEPSHAGDVGGASVWYRFTSAVSGSLELSTAGSDFDTLLAVYSGPGYGQLVGVGSGASTLTFSVTAGTTYRIVVDGDNRERGAVVLTPDFTPSSAPTNDDFVDAFALPGERSTISDSHSRLATHEVGEPAHAGSLGAGSVWWDVTVPVDGRLLVSTQGSSFDTVLGTYTGSAVNGLSPVASDDDTDGVQSQVWTPVTSGTDYHVAVDGASFSSTLGTGAVQLHTAVVDGDTGWYSPLASPVRLVDTRAGNVDALGTTDKTPLAPGQANVRRYVVTPIAGLAGASSVAINLTSVTQQGAGYLQLYPCAATTDAVPATSVLNFTPGAAIANNAIVGLIDNGFCVAAGGAASNIVIDAAGAYPDGLAYSALTDPARLVDTRPNTDALADPTDESTALGTNEVRRYVVPDAGDLPPAASIGALAVNLTAVSPGANGFLKAWPCDSTATPPPATSVLNFRATVNGANAGVLAVSPDGGFCVQASSSTHLIVDVSGTFAVNSSVVSSARPLRFVDTRPGGTGTLEESTLIDLTAPLQANTVAFFDLHMQAGVPGEEVAASALVNLTAVGAPANGFLTAWACPSAASTPPTASVLNYRAGVTSSNGSIVALTDTGICFVSSQPVNLIIDVTGWQAAEF